jgi:hypothetical protein
VGHFWELRSSDLSVVSSVGFLRSGEQDHISFVTFWHCCDVLIEL